MSGRLGAGALVLLLALADPAGAQGGATPEPDNCRTCHEVISDDRLAGPVRSYSSDVHAAQGFSCASCHGGDPAVAGFEGMDPGRGFVGVPRGATVIQVCGRCHADAGFMHRYNPALRVDQVTEYRTSVHGQRLGQFGDTAVATCASCHPAHAIRPASDPQSSVHPLNVAATCGRCHADAGRMAGYGIPTDQRDRYGESVHWRALAERGDQSAPTCNDCHGNHGAAPPGVTWVGNVCGQCHAVQAEYFARSPHADIFTRMGVPGCATCHDNHAIAAVGDTLLGVEEGTVCGRCHVAGVSGGAVATAMRAGIDSLGGAYDLADSLLTRAERAGMEVSQAQVDLGGARNALIQARAAVHTFRVDSVSAYVDSGLGVADSAIGRGRKALGELRFRRAGLVISVGLILLLITGLVLKIRQSRPPVLEGKP
jgi:predicted CXXCH cytochrome family protein